MNILSNMANHNLKTWPLYFNDVREGIKKFEVRKADRKFKVGDTLILEEFIPGRALDKESDGYTGESLTRKVIYVLKGGNFGIEHGYVILGLED